MATISTCFSRSQQGANPSQLNRVAQFPPSPSFTVAAGGGQALSSELWKGALRVPVGRDGTRKESAFTHSLRIQSSFFLSFQCFLQITFNNLISFLRKMDSYFLFHSTPSDSLVQNSVLLQNHLLPICCCFDCLSQNTSSSGKDAELLSVSEALCFRQALHIRILTQNEIRWSKGHHLHQIETSSQSEWMFCDVTGIKPCC